MNNSYEIQDILRLEHIKRWTVVPTVVQQSVASHTFNVVFIARAIAKLAHMSDDRIIKMALEHDLDEIAVGDIPTPGKKEIENKYGFKFSGSSKNFNEATDDEKYLLKIADLMEAYTFISQYGVGRYAEFTIDELDDRLNQLINKAPKRIADASYEVIVAILTKEFNYK